MQILENHKDDILFIARLIAFLGPVCIIVELFNIFKNRVYKVWRIMQLTIVIALTIISYSLLDAHNRLYISLEILVAIVVFAMVWALTRLFKPNR